MVFHRLRLQINQTFFYSEIRTYLVKMKGLAGTLLFVCLFLISVKSFAQQHINPGGFRHITVQEGLPSSEVYTLFQDKKGYIWMSTDAGVCRYNGYSFESFTTRNGLSDNTVFRMKEDNAGKIWAQGFSGALSYFDGKRFNGIPANEKLVALYNNGQKSSFCFETDEKGGITIGGFFTGGLFRTGPEDNFNSLIPVRPDGIDTNKQMIWINNQHSKTAYAAINYDGNGGSFFQNGVLSDISFYSKKGIASFYQCYRTKKGNIVFSFNEELYEINIDGTVSSRKLPSSIVSVCDDASGNIWVSLFFGGSYKFSDDNINTVPEIYFPGKTISCVFEDNEHGYWFSTVGDGVFYLPDIRFGYLTPAEGLAEPNIQSIAAFRKHELIIGLPNGNVSLFNPDTTGDMRLLSQKFNVITSLPCEAVISLHDSIIGSGNGLVVVDEKLHFIKIIQDEGHYKGVIRNSSTGELMFFSPSSFLFLNKKLEKEKLILTKIRFTAACFGNDGTVWLGALNGLWKLAGDEPVYMGDSIAGVKARIDAICQDKNNVLWIATRGEGVFAISGKQIWHFGERSGIASNTCRTIALDSSGGIWVGTNRGITLLTDFDPAHGTIKTRSFNSYHGLLCDEVKFILVHDQTIWMGSNEGLCWINVNFLKYDSVAPPIYVTNVLFGTDTCNLEKINVFDFSDKTIRIFIEGLSFKDPGNINYKYRISGLDNQWITTANREISFAGLSPGKYSVEILAVNGDGTESTHPAVFNFEILTPFYMSIWFILILIIFSISVVWISANYFVRKKQKRTEEKSETEKRIAELRLSALRAQMNPHFIFNAINSIQHFVLQNDSEHAYNYLAKFSNLIRLVLDQSQSESIPLDHELKMLKLYIELEQLRFERPFTYKIEVDSELQDENIKIPGMLVQPFVENAIWHGLLPKKSGDATLYISFRTKQRYVEITIEDNGVGRNAVENTSHEKTKRRSYGLQITEARLKLAEQQHSDQPTFRIIDLKDENGIASGTKVVINLVRDNYDD
ncbi:hypothetical protein BH09BAC5_BH09BAC5_24720 [soil metagenome]